MRIAALFGIVGGKRLYGLSYKLLVILAEKPFMESMGWVGLQLIGFCSCSICTLLHFRVSIFRRSESLSENLDSGRSATLLRLSAIHNPRKHRPVFFKRVHSDRNFINRVISLNDRFYS